MGPHDQPEPGDGGSRGGGRRVKGGTGGGRRTFSLVVPPPPLLSPGGGPFSFFGGGRGGGVVFLFLSAGFFFFFLAGQETFFSEGQEHGYARRWKLISRFPDRHWYGERKGSWNYIFISGRWGEGHLRDRIRPSSRSIQYSRLRARPGRKRR